MLTGATAREFTLTGAGAKAAAEPNRAMERTEKSFMLQCVSLLVNFLCTIEGKTRLQRTADGCGGAMWK